MALLPLVELTDSELSLLISTIGAMLASMSLDVPPGQPTPQAMLDVEALQAKLMNLSVRGSAGSK